MNPQLPPLPEGTRSYDHENGTWHIAYFAEQMTAYGLQCAEAERARCAALCRKVSAEDAAAVDRERNSILRSRFEYGAIVAEECASRILLANEPSKDTP